MAVNFNPALSSALPSIEAQKAARSQGPGSELKFGKALTKSLNKVNELHGQADTSITDLLTGKTADINSVVATVAKADMSFKLLVAVRNKLVSAYKETMKMQI
ncbi:MAG: flagellar hook-basal body complex protein FliE [Planctomycetota bacterium]|jgi:flagellar hook-basal body complex protein FliE